MIRWRIFIISFVELHCIKWRWDKLAAVASVDYIHVSSDSGVTWVSTNKNVGALNYRLIAISTDGTTLVAISPEYVYTSSDSGSTWTPRNVELSITSWAKVIK